MILLSELKYIFKNALYSDKKKSIATKWKQSLLAITFALILTSILIVIKGSNPISVFWDILNGATRNKESVNQMLIYFTMFILAGLSIIVGFKSGLFNIGIGGQMLISGVTMMIFAVKTSLPWPLILVLGMLISAIAASISGVLKSLFNIHEVVSTILINWIFFWISQYLLKPDHNWTDSFGTTKPIANASRMMIGDSIATPAIIVASFLLIGALILFNFTKFGFALKAVGQNQNASRYAAIKITFQLAFGMALSGLAAGALAGVNYLGKFGTMSYSTSQSLPGIGFQGISVALISFNSLLGLIPASLFWAIITSGADYASIVHPDIPKEVLSLMNGFIIYMIAISIVFIRFRPIKMFWLLYIRMTSEEVKKERAKYRTAKKSEKNLFISRNNDLKGISRNEIEDELNKLISKEKEINKKINIQKKQFKSKNKKPLKILNKNYNKEINVYNEKLYKYLGALYEKIDNLSVEKKFLISKLQKEKIKKNNNNLKRGIEIIRSEYKSRIKNIQNKYNEKSTFGRKLKEYNSKKIQNNQYNEEYNLLMIDFKKKIGIERKSLKEKIKIAKNNSEDYSIEVKKIKNKSNESRKDLKDKLLINLDEVENKIYRKGGNE